MQQRPYPGVLVQFMIGEYVKQARVVSEEDRTMYIAEDQAFTKLPDSYYEHVIVLRVDGEIYGVDMRDAGVQQVGI